MRLPCPRLVAPIGAGTAAEPPGPETGLGPPMALPLTAASDGVLVRLQEVASSGRPRRPGQARKPGGGCRHWA
eukprot:973789-Alexandrium_andersonii.AAC.1